MSKLTSTRISYWDNAKLLLIVFVVIIHFLDYLTGGNRLADAVYVYCNSFIMPMFLFISGVFLKYDENHKFRFDRFVFYIIVGYLMKFGIYLFDLIAGRTPNWSWLSTPNAPWYMFATAAYLLVTFLIRNVKPSVVLPVSLAVSLAAGFVNQIGDFMCLSKIIVFFPFFYAGFCMRPDKAQTALKNKALKAAGVITVVLFGVFCVGFTDTAYVLRPVFASRYSYEAMDMPVYGVLFRILQYVIGALMIVGVSTFITEKRVKYFTDAGKRTLAIYFIHYFVARLFAALNIHILLVQKFSLLGVVLVIFCAVLTTLVLSLPVFDIPFKLMQKAVSSIIFKLNSRTAEDQ